MTVTAGTLFAPFLTGVVTAHAEQIEADVPVTVEATDELPAVDIAPPLVEDPVSAETTPDTTVEPAPAPAPAPDAVATEPIPAPEPEPPADGAGEPRRAPDSRVVTITPSDDSHHPVIEAGRRRSDGDPRAGGRRDGPGGRRRSRPRWPRPPRGPDRTRSLSTASLTLL